MSHLLNEGDRIGDWVVVKKLGEGGMGAVYRCKDVLTGHIEVALKVMRPQGDPAERERFKREIEVLARASHPAIVQVRSGGEDAQRGLLYLAMELVQGEDLATRLGRGVLPPREAQRLLLQAAEGLAHAHALGVAHRDVKPANLMLCDDGQLRVVDFGIALPMDGPRLTRTDLTPGTLEYMPPEVFEGNVDPYGRDVYALAQTLYEALTAERPRFVKKAEAALDPGPAFPDRLREAVRRGSDPEPERRVPMAALVQLLRPGEEAAPPAPRTGRLWVALGASFGVGALVAGAVVIGALGLGVGRWSAGRSITPEADARVTETVTPIGSGPARIVARGPAEAWAIGSTGEELPLVSDGSGALMVHVAPGTWHVRAAFPSTEPFPVTRPFVLSAGQVRTLACTEDLLSCQ